MTSAVCVSGSLPIASASSTSLTVRVNGFRSQSGQLCLSLYSKAKDFPSSTSGAMQAQCLKAGTPTITFQNLSSGSYAVAVFHDANGDGTLNRNPIGIPTEGFGFSRNPRILTGPPAFSDSAVFVAGPGQNIDIKLNYML
ncbi:MAG: DUF2141 domain-containing protein [Cyanobacteria bacterium P01_A01_bin.17]